MSTPNEVVTTHLYQHYTNDELIHTRSISDDPLVRLLVERLEAAICNDFGSGNSPTKEQLTQMGEYCDQLEDEASALTSSIEKLRDRLDTMKQNLGNKP